jgi:5'-nucleotidase
MVIMSIREARPRRWVPAVVAPLAVLSLSVGACSSDDDSSSSSTTASSTTVADGGTEAAKELTILVTNDDGVGAPGIDVLVRALEETPDTKVVVAAPAENQSGTGGTTTPEGVTASSTTMLSGQPATAVAGFPADSVVWALDGGIPERPQLVVSGINSGQNVGAFIELSGTVGAARAAAARGVPALAVSAGFDDEPGFEAAARLVVDWIEEHRAALLDGSAGQLRGLVEVPAAEQPPLSLAPVDCSAPALPEMPVSDVTAIGDGWAALTELTVG